MSQSVARDVRWFADDGGAEIDVAWTQKRKFLAPGIIFAAPFDFAPLRAASYGVSGNDSVRELLKLRDSPVIGSRKAMERASNCNGRA